jgi:S1-C subfamily serine protease
VLFAKGQGRLVSLMSADIVIDPEEITLPPEMGSLAGAVVAEILLGNRLYGDVLGAEVLRVAAGSPAYWIGLEPGDVIVGIDNAGVRSPEELVYRVRRAGTELRIAIVRSGIPGLIRGQH